MSRCIIVIGIFQFSGLVTYSAVKNQENPFEWKLDRSLEIRTAIIVLMNLIMISIISILFSYFFLIDTSKIAAVVDFIILLLNSLQAITILIEVFLKRDQYVELLTITIK